MSNIVSLINGEALTTSLAVAEGVGYDHSTVIRLVRDSKEDLEEFGLLDFKSESTGGRPTEYALLNEDQATLLITYMRNNKIVRAFKKTLVKAFRDMRNGNIYQLPQTYPEALRAYADKCEESALIASERDDAIRTKALIGSKREASSMARASFEKRRADQLEKELGKHVTWKAAKAIDWIPVVFDPSRAMWSQIGKYLKRLTIEMNYQTGKIEDTAFGKVNAYHIDVITEAYKRIKEDKNILSKYRTTQENAA